MVWPATGSQYGLFDYCGFPKEQAYMLWGEVREIPVDPEGTVLIPSKTTLKPDGQDVVVVDVISDEQLLLVSADGATILGWGNGDPGFKEKERPGAGENRIVVKPFSGRAQILVRSIESSTGPVTVYWYNLNNALNGCLADSFMHHCQPFERGLFIPLDEHTPFDAI